MLANQARQVAPRRLPNVEGVSNRGDYQLGLRQGRQVDKVRSSWKIPEDILHALQGQAGFAGSAGSSEGQGADCGIEQLRLDRGPFLIPSDKGGPLNRKIGFARSRIVRPTRG